MERALNAAFDILSFRPIMALVVLAALIAGMMGIFNFAHGEFALLGLRRVQLRVPCLAPHGRR